MIPLPNDVQVSRRQFAGERGEDIPESIGDERARVGTKGSVDKSYGQAGKEDRLEEGQVGRAGG